MKPVQEGFLIAMAASQQPCMLLSLLLLGLMSGTVARECKVENGEMWVAASGCDPTCEKPEPIDCNIEFSPPGCACIPGYVRVDTDLCKPRSEVCAPCQARKCGCTFGFECAPDEEACPAAGCYPNPCPPGCICCCRLYAPCQGFRTCTIVDIPCWKMKTTRCRNSDCGTADLPEGKYCCCKLNGGSCPWPRKCLCFKQGCDCLGYESCPPEKCPKDPCPVKRPNCCCRTRPERPSCSRCDECQCLHAPCETFALRRCKARRCRAECSEFCCCKPERPPCDFPSALMLHPCSFYKHDYGYCPPDQKPQAKCCCITVKAEYCAEKSCCKCMRRRWCHAFNRKYCPPWHCGHYCQPWRCCCRGKEGLLSP